MTIFAIVDDRRGSGECSRKVGGRRRRVVFSEAREQRAIALAVAGGSRCSPRTQLWMRAARLRLLRKAAAMQTLNAAERGGCGQRPSRYELAAAAVGRRRWCALLKARLRDGDERRRLLLPRRGGGHKVRRAGGERVRIEQRALLRRWLADLREEAAS